MIPVTSERYERGQDYCPCGTPVTLAVFEGFISFGKILLCNSLSCEWEAVSIRSIILLPLRTALAQQGAYAEATHKSLLLMQISRDRLRDVR